MKLLVISDTHCKGIVQVEQLLDLLRPFAADVEMILHAGDHVMTDVVDALEELAPTYAVRGNMDAFPEGGRYPRQRVVEAGRQRIGLTHGDGAPFGLVERVRRQFAEERLDALVFGHTHEALLAKENGLLILNPGSPTDRRFTDRNSLAIVRAGQGLAAEIVKLPR